MSGPAPKRSTERRRRNADSAATTVKVEVGTVIEIPKPSTRWHPMAKDWYLSLAQSGQATFYEPSDWQVARYLAEVMSINLRQTKKFSAVLFASVMSGMTDLLTTEASRRRVRIEIERNPGGAVPESAGVTAMADYRKRLSASGGSRRGSSKA